MLARKKWLAVINGGSWILANVARHKDKLIIYELIELENQKSPETLQKVIKAKGLMNKKINIALSCSGIITRIIVLPLLKPKELETLLTEQVDQYFTLNVSDYLIDYKILETFQEEGQTRQKVLLAAIPKYQWEDYIRTWDCCNIKPKSVDLAADALARLYSRQIPSEDSADLAIVEINENRVQFILFEQGIFFLYSDQEIDLSKLRVSKEAENLFMPVLQTLSEFINFFAARHYGKRVDQVYLTGTLADTPLFMPMIENSLNIKTVMGFPKNWQPEFTEKAIDHQSKWMRYGTLYGLAYKEDK